MVMEEIQQKIDYYNECINDCSLQIDELNEKYEKACIISTSLSDYINRVSEDMEMRRCKLSRCGNNGVRSKILGKYYEGMNEMLSGGEYQQTFYDLDQGLQKVNGTIIDLEDRIASLSGQRNDAWSNKTYWEEQMQYADDFSA